MRGNVCVFVCANDKVGVREIDRLCVWQVRAAGDCLLIYAHTQQKDIRLFITKVRRAVRSNISHFH